jgi:steroid delta-isomerase-like uncharacterized protein
VEAVAQLCTDDCLYEDVPTGSVNHSRDELRAFAQFWFAVSPDLKIELSSEFSTDARAAGEWTMSGTQQGDMPGMPATKKPFSFRGATILETEKGMIRRCTDYWDMAEVLRQLGFMSAPSPPAVA